MCECVHCVTVYGQRKPPSPFVFVHVCILFRSIEMRTKALDDNFCMKLLWPFECTAAYNNLARESRKRLGIMLLAGGTFRRKLFKPVIELSLEIASVSYCRQLLLWLWHNGFIKRAFDFGSYLYYHHHDHHTLISQMEFLCLSAIDRCLMRNCILL